MKIGITIGDNDFQRTIEAFLRLFYDSRVIMDAEYCCHGNLLQDCGATHRGTVEPVTKEQIILMWNHLKVGLYLLVQRGFRTYAGNPPQRRHEISRYERNRATPNVLTLQQIAAVLGVSPCWLAFGEGAHE